MSSIPKAVESRGRFLERIEGGVAGEAQVDERLVALTAPMSAAAEQYRMLLHRLRHLRALRGEAIQGGMIIAVTSAVRGEGVSLTAANLALTAARSRDARVALVDCDLRRGGSAPLFGMGSRAGPADVLARQGEGGAGLGPRGTSGGDRRGTRPRRGVGVASGGPAVRADPVAAPHAVRLDLPGRAARAGPGGRAGGRVQGGRHRDGGAGQRDASRAGG